jgi:hypothetical protein
LGRGVRCAARDTSAVSAGKAASGFGDRLGDQRTPGENLWITRRAAVVRPGVADAAGGRSSDPGAAATAHTGRSNRVINSFPLAEQGPLSSGKFFGIMALSGIFRDDPRQSVRPSMKTTVSLTLLQFK